MRLRFNPQADALLADCPLVIQPKKDDFNQWRSMFGDEHPLHLELGAGKGGFAISYALAHPDINLIAVERSPTVAAVMAKKAMQVEGMRNLRIIVGNVADLSEWFGPDSVSAIFLNFSDPWPKKRHASRRLTHIGFIKKYQAVCKKNTLVTLKTDNQSLYDFTLEHLHENGFVAEYNSLDLYQRKVPAADAIVSEYERKFSSAGVKIKKITFRI